MLLYCYLHTAFLLIIVWSIESSVYRMASSLTACFTGSESAGKSAMKAYGQKPWRCTGALLDSSHVITAAHCVDDGKVDGMRFYPGTSVFNNGSYVTGRTLSELLFLLPTNFGCPLASMAEQNLQD